MTAIGVVLKIHDLPIKYPMDGMSFHASDSPVDRVFWDGEVLEVVTKDGECWVADFDAMSWSRTGSEETS